MDLLIQKDHNCTIQSMVSVIIPFYNEEANLPDCLHSLEKQSLKPLEIIAVDDGSTDKSISNIKYKISNIKKVRIKFVQQKHQGPGMARNFGAREAKGDILVFVDADMTFDKDFIKDLVTPIMEGHVIGTFSKEEYLLNKSNPLAILWNINRYLINGWKLDSQTRIRILPKGYPDTQPVFRAIRKKDFLLSGGFDSTGYTDDWTLSKKMGKYARAAIGAVYYHKNPDTIKEIFLQARWIGRNEFLVGNIARRLFNLVRYSFPSSCLSSLYVISKTGRIDFLPFKIVYDLGIWISLWESFLSKSKYKN